MRWLVRTLPLLYYKEGAKMENVTQIIRRTGTVVELTTDGRTFKKTFDTEADAIRCYEEFKAKIVEAEKKSQL